MMSAIAMSNSDSNEETKLERERTLVLTRFSEQVDDAQRELGEKLARIEALEEERRRPAALKVLVRRSGRDCLPLGRLPVRSSNREGAYPGRLRRGAGSRRGTTGAEPLLRLWLELSRA